MRFASVTPRSATSTAGTARICTSLQRITYPRLCSDARSVCDFIPAPECPVGRMIVTKTVVHVADLAAEPIYIERRNPGIIAAVEVGGVRTLLAVPLLKDNQLIGSFHFPPGSPPIHRETNHAGHELRRSSCYRHREHATAQRAAGSPCNSRPRLLTCSRSFQPLDIRSADGAGHHWTNRRPLLRGKAAISFAGTARSCTSLRRKLRRLLSRERWRSLASSPPIRRSAAAALPGRSPIWRPEQACFGRVATPTYRAPVRAGRIRSVLAVPLLRDGTTIGVFALTRA